MSAQPTNTPEMSADDLALALLDVSLQQLGIRYSATVTETEITITTKTYDELVKIQEHINKSHKNSKSFFANLPYTVLAEDSSNPSTQPENTPAAPSSAPTATAALNPSANGNPPTLAKMFEEDAAQVEAPPEPEDTVEAAKGILLRLFGKKVYKKHAIDPDALCDEAEGAFVENGVLYSIKADDEDIAILWNKYNEALLRRFLDVDVETIAKVWVKGDKHLPEQQKIAKNLKLSGKVKEFFGVLVKETASGEKEIRLYFKFRTMYRSIFQPKVEIQGNMLTGYSLVIDKQHYTEYLERISAGETLLTVHKPSAGSKKLIASPVMFGNKKLNPLQRQYEFIIDRSGSMGVGGYGADVNYVAQLREFIRPFIERLKTFSETDPVRIAMFDDKLEAENFRVSDTTAIRDFMQTKDPRGDTHLYRTIESELDLFLQKRDPNALPIIFLMTDGGDSQTGYSEPAIQRIKDKLAQFKALNLPQPKIFTFGFGRYDIKTLNSIADNTGMPLIHLKTMADFQQIYDYLRSIQYEDRMVQLVIGKNGISNRFEVPVLLDGNARSVKVKIPFAPNERISIAADGKKSVIVVEDADKVPVASIKDWAISARFKAHRIITNGSPDADRLKTLLTLQTEVDKGLGATATMNEAEKALVKKTAVIVSAYIADLQEIISKQNDGLRQSQISKARYELRGQSVGAEEDLHIEDILPSDALASNAPQTRGFLGLGAAAAELTAPPFAREYEVLDVADAGLEIYDEPYHEAIAAPAASPATGNGKANTAGNAGSPATRNAATERKMAADIPGTQQKMKAVTEKPAESASAKESPTTAQAPAKPKMHNFIPASMNQAADNPTPVLMHEGSEGHTLVFSNTEVNARALPKPTVAVTPANSTPSNSNASASQTNAASQPNSRMDINQNTCRPVQFNGKPSVYCQGHSESTGAVDVIHTPTLPEPPTAIQDSNIMLGAVVAHWGKSLWNYGKSFFNGTSTKEEAPSSLTKKGFGIKLKMLNDRLQEISESLKALPSDKVAELSEALEDCRYGLSEIRSNGYQDPSARELLRDLADSTASLLEQAKAAKIEATPSKKLSAAAARAASRIKPGAKSAQLGGHKPDQCPVAALPGSAAVLPMLTQFQTNYAALVGANAIKLSVQAPMPVQMVAASAPIRALKS